MKPADVALCLACVALGSTGQVLLRAASVAAQQSAASDYRSWLSVQTMLALPTYGAGLLLWMWVLTRVPLTQAFAFFGLSFFCVPLLANWIVGDPLSSRTWLGAVIIVAGILVTVWPQR